MNGVSIFFEVGSIASLTYLLYRPSKQFDIPSATAHERGSTLEDQAAKVAQEVSREPSWIHSPSFVLDAHPTPIRSSSSSRRRPGQVTKSRWTFLHKFKAIKSRRLLNRARYRSISHRTTLQTHRRTAAPPRARLWLQTRSRHNHVQSASVTSNPMKKCASCLVKLTTSFIRSVSIHGFVSFSAGLRDVTLTVII